LGHSAPGDIYIYIYIYIYIVCGVGGISRPDVISLISDNIVTTQNV